MSDVPVSPIDHVNGRQLNPAARARLLGLLQAELTRASRDALADGMTPAELAVQFDERITRLRAQIADLSGGD